MTADVELKVEIFKRKMLIRAERGLLAKMSTIPLKNGTSAAKLLQATANLSPLELDSFVSQAIVLRAKRQAPNVSHNEAELLLKINQGLAPRLQKRFDELAEKLRAESITSGEREEFLRLTNRIEKQDAKRIELLGKLAAIRQKTLDVIIKELGIGQF
jgi:hypothetical protein